VTQQGSHQLVTDLLRESDVMDFVVKWTLSHTDDDDDDDDDDECCVCLTGGCETA